MTLKEAIKILEKEGFHISLAPMVINQTGAIREFEKPEVCEAIKVANANKWKIGLSPVEWDEREARLKKEYGKNHIKRRDPIPCSPALKEAASKFNDALLDEQGKKIKRFGKEIARLNKIIRKKNLKIEELRKESCRHLNGKIKEFGENVDLEQKLKDKDAVLSDVAEELRLSKIREKNLVEVSQKYMNKNKELKKELEEANNLVKEVRKVSKEYCEYGIAAEKMIQKLAKIIVSKGLVPSNVFEKCRLWANGYRFNPQLPELSKGGNGIFYHIAGVDVAEEGADHTGVMVLCGKDFAKILKEDKEAAKELSKVLNDVIDRFLLFGEIIIKEE